MELHFHHHHCPNESELKFVLSISIIRFKVLPSVARQRMDKLMLWRHKFIHSLALGIISLVVAIVVINNLLRKCIGN